MKHKNLFVAMALFGVGSTATSADACTGITLKSRDNAVIAARTIDWSGAEMENMYVIVPRAHTITSVLPNGKNNGIEFTTKYGYVGLAVEEPLFIVDGTNEAGLSAALFYFPGYGKYVNYDPEYNSETLADFQVVSWILSNFSTIDEVKQAISNVRIVNIDSRAQTVHWRITEPSGRQVVMEITNGIPQFYDSKIGVLTNSPGFEWQMTNLNNYVNLRPGTAGPVKMEGTTLAAFGAGSGFMGLPGDMTPPSRFVRAAFFQSYSIPQNSAIDAIDQAFHILNTFDVPLGIQFANDSDAPDMPSATQWTIATDLKNKVIYYHTMYNRTIRNIDMNTIDFAVIPYQWHPLDTSKKQTIIPVQIDTTPTPEEQSRNISDIAAKVFKSSTTE